ncbi:hypothetical protein BKH44_06200 [Helicobacter sp. 13S00477-4]|nr:hypothetical protein BKH44_06200 [Helicobacter sp. 13S00477-4]
MLNWSLQEGLYYPSFSYISPKYISSKNNQLYISIGFDKIFLKKREDIWVYFHPTDSSDLIGEGLMYRVIAIASLKYIALSKYMSYLDSLSIPPLVMRAENIDNEEDLEKMMDLLFNLRSNSVGIFGKNDTLELLNGNVDKGTFLEFIRYCDEGISKLITGQVLAGNSTSNGTQALGNVHDKIRKNTEEYDAALMSEGIRELLKKALILNFKDVKDFSFELDTNTESDENEQMEVFVKLKQIGIDIPLEHLEQTFKIKGLTRSQIDFSNPKDELLEKNTREDNKVLKTSQTQKPLSELEIDDTKLEPYEEKIKSIVQTIANKASTYQEAYDELLNSFENKDFDIAEEALFDLLGNAELKGSIDGKA